MTPKHNENDDKTRKPGTGAPPSKGEGTGKHERDKSGMQQPDRKAGERDNPGQKTHR